MSNTTVDVDASAFAFAAPPRNDGADIRADKFQAPYLAKQTPVAGSFMTTVEKEDFHGYHIFLLHGGGYVMEGLSMHADIMRTLADQGHRVTIFNFPLAPEHQHEEIQDAIYTAFEVLRTMYPDDRFAIYGDSAGGALGMNLLIRLRDGGEDYPKKCVWASPAVDISMTNPDILPLKETDKSLNYDFVLAGGKSYAGDTPLTDSRISPLYADLRDLGDMLMFFGENELLRPDCEKLIEKLDQTPGTNLQWHMAPERGHDFLLMVNLPASVDAFARIAEFLK